MDRIFSVAGNIPTKHGVVAVSYGMARLSVGDSGITANLWPALLRRVLNGDPSSDCWTASWSSLVEVRISGRKQNAFVLVSPPQNCRVLLRAGADAIEFSKLLAERAIPSKTVETTLGETFRGLQDP